MSRVIAIGDIHGCSNALFGILDRIAPTPDDTIITLGDYIDRGPNSRGVIDRLLELREECELITLIGNHEIMCLCALDNPADMPMWLSAGGKATLMSYGGEAGLIPQSHREFMAGCLRSHETESHLFVHANYIHDLPLCDQPSSALFWEHITRRLPPPHMSGKTAVVGHTPQHSGQVLDAGHLIAIDTYVFGEGLLTALEVHTGQLWQATKNGRVAERKLWGKQGRSL